jgi:hypothetical protein
MMFSNAAFAFDEQPVFTEESYTLEDIIEQIPNFSKTPEGGVDWKLFAETGEVPRIVEVEKEPWEVITPVFSEPIKALDGEIVKLSGYMFPLDENNEQGHFLFGPFPLTCPYHYHAPFSLTLEVNPEKPITFSYDEIILEGRLELVPEDLEYNIFYKLHDAKVVEK